MALRISDSHLILIAQGTKVKINDLRLGVELAKQSGLTIDQLTENALKDRL